MIGDKDQSRLAAERFVAFVDEACTPYHAVATVLSQLRAAGYTVLDEKVEWPSIVPGGRYVVVRQETSLIAFHVGGSYERGGGAKIVGAHTDSPNLQLKPHTRSTSAGAERVGVQCYGGGLWHTWFDRDLTVAGRVIVCDQGALHSRLVRITEPIMRIPTLAIHLRTAEEREAFAPNKEKHVIPLIARQAELTVNGEKGCAPSSKEKGIKQKQCGPLMRRLSSAIGCTPEDIVDFDLSVIDAQPPTMGGCDREFIFAARLDNLISCFCAVDALLHAADIEGESQVRVIALFDHEEIGSQSAQGAGGSFLPDVLHRVATALDGTPLPHVFVANSFILSVDGAHACHPNYADKHESEHRPRMGGGPVLKFNANVRYATNGMSAAIVREAARRASVPLQEFVVKNDSPCGSTIGPITSALTGIMTADIGNPMLSMHSIREMCGAEDIDHLTRLITSLFQNKLHLA